MPLAFLSPAWIDAARELRAKYESKLGAATEVVRINQVITDTPFGDDGILLAHIDTSSGSLAVDLGAVDNPDATVTTDYETAKQVLLSNDPQTTMQALLMGKLKIDGDSQKVMSLQSHFAMMDTSGELAEKMLAELRELTD